MELTIEKAKELMEENNGSLDLSGTKITSLPDGLTVGGSLDLSGTKITSLPDGLTVGGSLYLRGTQITSLPDGLTVGGSLDLSGTQITSLPDGLTVGGSLDLSGTQITSLPDNLKVGRGVYSGKGLVAPKLRQGDYVPGKYLYADGILTHIKSTKKIGDYTFYVGRISRIKGRNVISDGEYYAHCDKPRDGIQDLIFKKAKDRGTEQFGNLTLDSVLPADEMIQMYRIITGACRQGTEQFVQSLGRLKDSYTVKEAIELTKGQYGAERFEGFFERSNNQ